MATRRVWTIITSIALATVFILMAVSSVFSGRSTEAQATTAAPNLLQNGSFETPVVANPCPNGGTTNSVAGICTYRGGSTGIPHWAIGGDSVDIFSSKINPSSFGPAEAGVQLVDLSGNAPGSLTQSVPTTADVQYVLKWFIQNGVGNGNAEKVMHVFWDGVLMASPKTTSSSWTEGQITVLAIGPESVVKFADASPGATDQGTEIDNVSLAQN